MILHDLPPGTTLFRAHTPQWASRPTSGAGAAAKGGRFNREGIEALYLSLEEVTALREYQQTSPFLSPCTMCSYTVTLRRLVDLRQLHQGDSWDELWHDWREDWRHLKFDLHIERLLGCWATWCWPRATRGSCSPARRTTAAPMSSCTWIDSRTAIPSWSTIPTGGCPATNPAGSADNATPSHLSAPCRSKPYPQGIAGTHSLPCGTNRARMGCGLLTESLPADADAGDSLLHHESLRWPTNAQNPCN